jgi:hypothetical protein
MTGALYVVNNLIAFIVELLQSITGVGKKHPMLSIPKTEDKLLVRAVTRLLPTPLFQE